MADFFDRLTCADKTAQASFVEGFGEPGGDGLMNGFAREIGARWMLFDDS